MTKKYIERQAVKSVFVLEILIENQWSIAYNVSPRHRLIHFLRHTMLFRFVAKRYETRTESTNIGKLKVVASPWPWKSVKQRGEEYTRRLDKRYT